MTFNSGGYCPVCGKVWDLSHNFCPNCSGVILVRVWDYGKGFVKRACEDDIDDKF